jgi:hypothetical protein
MKRITVLLLTVCIAIFSVHRAQADLRDGLVSYWPLDVLTPDVNTGMNISPDVGPNTNHLTDNFTMAPGDLVPGVRGNAASFDGVSKYLSHIYTVGEGNGLPIYNTRYYTISMWVRDGKNVSGTNQQNRVVFAEASNLSANPLFRFTTDFAAAGRTNLLVAAIRNNNNSYYFGNPGVSFADNGKSSLGTNMPFDGGWHHIAWVDQNGTARLYVDGQLDPHVYKNTRISEPSDVAAANHGLTLNTFSIGAFAQATVGGFFHGLVDDVAVWERALTQEEIDQVRTNGISLPILASAPAVTNQPVGNTNLLVGQSFALQALAIGTHPRSYQWYKDGIPLMDLVEMDEFDQITNAPIVGTASNILVLTNLQTSYSGDYSFVVSNLFGSANSSVATLLISTASPQTPDLTNGMIAYWPLDAVQGITTPDVVRGYDMRLGTPAAGTMGLSAANVVPGKWGNAVKFNTNGILSRIHSPGDDLPISQYRNHTVSVWINAPTNQQGQRYFAEGNLSSANPWVSLGQVDNATQAATVNPTAPLSSMRAFIRNDANQNNSTVGASGLSVFYDPFVEPGGAWHHVVYVQEEVGGDLPVLSSRLYVDGVRDTAFVGSPRLPRSVQNTTIGGALRTGISGAFGGGMIDDVAVWARALTDLEIAMLSTNVTPAAPPVLTPLQITSFRSDLPSVVSGENAILRWNVSSSAASVDIDEGVGSVLSRTTNGFGNIVISNLTASKTFTLTIQRGTNVETAQTTIAVVNGVAGNWSILDDFQSYNAGAFVNPYWSDMNGGSTVEGIGGNRMLNAPSGGGQVALLPLAGLSVNEGQARTLFFRVCVQDETLTTAMLNQVGLTDKSLRNANDIDTDVGPIVRLHDDSAGDLAIGARDGSVVPIPGTTLIPRKLEHQQVYNIWIDITNGTFVTEGDFPNTGDTFSIWLQRLGETGRTLIASNWTTDRDLEPDFLTATGLHLDQLAVGNDGGSTGTVYVDDIYISKSGYNATVPVAWAGPTPPALSTPDFITDTGSFPGQISLSWDAGALMFAPELTGPWRVVPDSFGLSYFHVIEQTNAQFYFRIQR